jgi:hypothetical protein
MKKRRDNMREIIREDPNSELSNERSSYCER